MRSTTRVLPDPREARSNPWGRKRRRAKKRGGFTFAEVLAAMLFMAIVLPVAIRGLVIANRAGAVAERKREAAQLADWKLTELAITGDWRETDREGDFGLDWPEYRWVFLDEAWEEDTMRLLTMRVLFSVQEREYSVQLSRLASEIEE